MMREMYLKRERLTWLPFSLQEENKNNLNGSSAINESSRNVQWLSPPLSSR